MYNNKNETDKKPSAVDLAKKKIVAHIIKSKDNIFNANIVKIRVNPKIIKMFNVVKEF